MERWRVTSQYDRLMEADKWVKQIPALNFDKSWSVKIIPPFGGAVSRFVVLDEHENRVSVYLDCYDSLGIMGEPYWEIYPYENDTYRIPMNNPDELIERIREAFAFKHKQGESK